MRRLFRQSLLESFPRIWQTPWLPVAVLSLIVWVTFGQVVGNDLVFDDLDTIRDNQAIASLKNLTILFSKDYFRLSDEYSYRPVVTLSYLFDAAVAGKNPAFYHIHNLVLHHANVLLVFALFSLLGAGQWRSFAMALVFALHPLHAEAVLFPGFREDLQMTLGMLAMSCCLVADRRQPAALWIAGATLALAFALFAKEGALLVPVAWLAFDAILNRRGRQPVALRRRYGPLAFVVLVFAVIRFVAMTNPHAAEMDVIEQLPLRQRLLTAPFLFAYSLRRFFWPMPLCVIHEIEALPGPGPAFYLSLLVVAAVVVLCIVVARGEKWLWLAGLWILTTFAPVANVYPIVNLWAERFYYAVGVGTSALLVAAIGALWDRLSRRTEERRRLARAVVAWIVVSFLAWAAAVCDLKRILECRTSLSLWRATVRCVPTNATALATLAVAELEAGNIRRAEEAALRAEQYEGGVYRVNFILGQAALRRQNWREAIAYFEKALTVPSPSIASQTHLAFSLASAYLKVEETTKAATLLHQALETDPDNPALRTLLRQVEPKPNGTVSTSPTVSRKNQAIPDE